MSTKPTSFDSKKFVIVDPKHRAKLSKSAEDFGSKTQTFSLKIRAKSTQCTPKITTKAIPPVTQKYGRKLRRNLSSSTMTQHVEVEKEVIINCLSRAVYYEVKSNIVESGKKIDLFCEDNIEPKAMSDIEEFLTQLFTLQDISPPCGVTAAAYIDQLTTLSGIKLNNSNWRRILLISLLEADKVWRDQLVWNEDYKDAIPGLDLVDLQKMETLFLMNIQFNLNLTPSEYAKYYFELLSLRDTQSEPVWRVEYRKRRSNSDGPEPCAFFKHLNVHQL